MKPTPLRLDSIWITWEDDDVLHDTGAPFMNCTAHAEISYAIQDEGGDRRIEHFSSGGLFEIDPTSTATYMHEIEADELADLRDHLAHFGIVPTDAEWNGLLLSSGSGMKDHATV